MLWIVRTIACIWILLFATSAFGAESRLIVVPQPIPPLNPILSEPPIPSAREPSRPQEPQSNTGQRPTGEDQRGTDQVPLSVKVLPTPKSQTEIREKQSRADEHAANERGLTSATWVLAAITLFLVLVGGGQLALFYVQLQYIRESLNDAKIAAEAARDGAIAAREHADTTKLSMIASDRAYVHQNGFRWISHPHSESGRIFWRIRPMWITAAIPQHASCVFMWHTNIVIRSCQKISCSSESPCRRDRHRSPQRA